MTNFDVENTRRDLIAMREKHGANTPVGHRISNLIEQVQNLRTATGEQRENLIRSMQKSMDEIKALTPEPPPGAVH